MTVRVTELHATLLGNHSTAYATGVKGAGGSGGPGRVLVDSDGAKPPEKSHVIRLPELSTKPQNVAIPTITIQIMK